MVGSLNHLARPMFAENIGEFYRAWPAVVGLTGRFRAQIVMLTLC